MSGTIYVHPNIMKQLFEKFKRTGSIAFVFVGNVGKSNFVVTVATLYVIQNIITAYQKSSACRTVAACSLCNT